MKSIFLQIFIESIIVSLLLLFFALNFRQKKENPFLEKGFLSLYNKQQSEQRFGEGFISVFFRLQEMNKDIFLDLKFFLVIITAILVLLIFNDLVIKFYKINIIFFAEEIIGKIYYFLSVILQFINQFIVSIFGIKE